MIPEGSLHLIPRRKRDFWKSRWWMKLNTVTIDIKNGSIPNTAWIREWWFTGGCLLRRFLKGYSRDIIQAWLVLRFQGWNKRKSSLEMWSLTISFSLSFYSCVPAISLLSSPLYTLFFILSLFLFSSLHLVLSEISSSFTPSYVFSASIPVFRCLSLATDD